jgi:hypothetical protein
MLKTKWFGKIVLAAAVTLTASSPSWAAEYIQGYYRSNGTYVQPYWRSDPDGNPFNNYGYPANLNPYTGEVAPGNPDTYLATITSETADSAVTDLITEPVQTTAPAQIMVPEMSNRSAMRPA